MAPRPSPGSSPKRRVTREFFAAHTVSELEQQSDYWLEEQGRLTEPMRYDRATDHYVPIAWDEAFAMIARELRALADPNKAEFYTSGRTSNEAAFLYQLFARRYGTNNFPDCSNMCHEPTSVGLPESIGIGKGTVVLDDFAHADAIFIIGQNPGTNSPRMMTELHKASRRGRADHRLQSAARAGARALRRAAGSDRDGDLRLDADRQRVLPGQSRRRRRGAQGRHEDGAGGERGGARSGARTAVLDTRFHRRAYPWLRGVRRRSPPHALGRHPARQRPAARRNWSGLPPIYMQARRSSSAMAWASPSTGCGTANVQQIANLLLLRGNFGRPGAGICPVRGHSNVQGDRTVGIDEKPKPELLDRIETSVRLRAAAGPRHNVVDAREAMIDGRAKVFIGLGGNFAAAVPDRP